MTLEGRGGNAIAPERRATWRAVVSGMLSIIVPVAVERGSVDPKQVQA
jgi:hypothetical protein